MHKIFESQKQQQQHISFFSVGISGNGRGDSDDGTFAVMEFYYHYFQPLLLSSSLSLPLFCLFLILL